MADEDDEDEIKVPEERLARLRMVVTAPVTSLSASQTQLRHYLSHSKLAQIIRDINSVPVRGRKKRLQSQIEKDKAFAEVIDCMLKEMGYLNNQGEFSASGL